MTSGSPHRRLFAVVMWCIPVLFFALLEGGLRLAGYGDDYPVFVPVSEAPEYLVMNTELARRYFRRETRVPTGLHDVFLARKDSHVVRIVVQGGSSAAGYPYYYGGSFSRMLEQRLQQSWPERHIEVINTAMAAVNSYTMLDVSDEIIEIRPDVVLIYAGHNEFYGALGVGSSESLGQSRSMIRLYLQMQSWRTMQWLGSVITGLAGEVRGSRTTPTTLMERMVGQQTIPYESPEYKAGLTQWELNLRALLRKYQKEGILVLVGTVASNERTHAPFVSLPSDSTDIELYNEKYQAALASGDLTSALELLQELVELDAVAAQPHYAMAQLLDASGSFADARQAYLKAKDRDQLRFRASEAINAISRDAAADGGAMVVDTQGALVRAARDGIIGDDLMLEHLHPNMEGYFLIADAFYEALVAGGVLGTTSNYVPRELARREVLFTSVDSLFGQYRVSQLLSAWPFQPLGTPMDNHDSLTATSQVEAIAQDLFRGEIQWYEATDRLRMHYERQGDYHRALQASLAMIQQFPYLPGPYAQAADIMLRQGRAQDAVVYFEAANDLEETAHVHYVLGMVHMQSGRVVAAGQHLEQAVALDPESAAMRFDLTQYYMVVREWSKAEASLQVLLELDPDHESADELQAYIAERR